MLSTEVLGTPLIQGKAGTLRKSAHFVGCATKAGIRRDGQTRKPRLIETGQLEY